MLNINDMHATEQQFKCMITEVQGTLYDKTPAHLRVQTQPTPKLKAGDVNATNGARYPQKFSRPPSSLMSREDEPPWRSCYVHIY